MNASAFRPSAAAVWASLFLAVLPLAYLAALDFALHRGALEQAQAEKWMPFFRVLGSPGLLLCWLFNCQPWFWVEHSRGSVFWEMLVMFLVTNLVGWMVLATSATLGTRWLKVRLARRRRVS